MPLIEHRGRRPTVHPTAHVAPDAVLAGDIRVGPGARVLFGAVLTAEDGRVELGAHCVVMEHALVRGRAQHPAVLGDDVLVGPHAHINGAHVEDGCFLATGVALFPGARVGAGSEVRVNAVVHVNTTLTANTTVPIGWIAAGDPGQLFAPGQHDELWAVQRELDFPQTVYGVPRGTDPATLMRRQSAWFGAHADDRVLDPAQRRGSGARWEELVGYSRTVAAGPLLLVAGTTADDLDGDLHAQTLDALRKVERALADAGATLAEVVQTRLFVTDIARWEEAGRAHGEVFAAIRPVTSMVEVSALIDPRMLVEVEATAWRS